MERRSPGRLALRVSFVAFALIRDYATSAPSFQTIEKNHFFSENHLKMFEGMNTLLS